MARTFIINIKRVCVSRTVRSHDGLESKEPRGCCCGLISCERGNLTLFSHFVGFSNHSQPQTELMKHENFMCMLGKKERSHSMSIHPKHTSICTEHHFKLTHFWHISMQSSIWILSQIQNTHIFAAAKAMCLFSLICPLET